MKNKIVKLEEVVNKRKENIRTLQDRIKKEKARLKKDEDHLTHLKYDEVLKQMQQKNVDPKTALEAIDSISTVHTDEGGIE